MQLSLLRTKDQVAAEVSFVQLRDKLPLLLECVPDLLSKDLVQEVVLLVRNNPSWTLAHLAAHLGLVDCFKNQKVAAQICQPAQDTLATPLHIAVRAQKLNSVQVLMGMDAPLNLTDHNGDTIYHAAAVTTKELIKALSVRPAPTAVINQVNNDGYTPLQLACLTDKPECVRELLKEGADVNSASVNLADRNNSTCLGRDHVEQNGHNFQIEDMKHGGTPLHWAKTTQTTWLPIDAISALRSLPLTTLVAVADRDWDKKSAPQNIVTATGDSAREACCPRSRWRFSAPSEPAWGRSPRPQNGRRSILCDRQYPSGKRLYDFTFNNTLETRTIPLSRFRGYVVLVVNVATY
ncbi:85/88 kDa calcium-independent phospholipase A2 [Ixodes scapularis]